MARQIDLFCTPQLMGADIPQPLRSAVTGAACQNKPTARRDARLRN